MVNFFSAFWKDILVISGPIGFVLGGLGGLLGHPTCSTAYKLEGAKTTCESTLWGGVPMNVLGTAAIDPLKYTLAGIGAGAFVGLLIGLAIVALRPSTKKDVLPEIDL